MRSVYSEAGFAGRREASAGASVPSCRARSKEACYLGAEAWRGWEGGCGGRRRVMHCGGAMLAGVAAAWRRCQVAVVAAAGQARRRRGVTPRRPAWPSPLAGQARRFVFIFSIVPHSV